ncbi:MAG: CHAT domain-containing protein [Acidobacteria bacterium]|nr:CHAT domain-containing protein [Acidobacteriota bacterium]
MKWTITGAATVARETIKMKSRIMKLRFPGSAYASRSTLTGLLLLSATVLVTAAGIQGQSNTLPSIRTAFNNGRFDEVVRIAPQAVLHARTSGTPSVASEIGVFHATALMRLERYDEAKTVLEDALTDAVQAKRPQSIAAVYLAKATLSRARRDFPGAIKFARSALAAAPADRQIVVEYHLAIGRIMYSSGYDIAAIIWLERSEKLSAGLPVSAAYLDVLGHLSLAWASKFNYSKAIEYAERLVKISEKTHFKYRHRLALYEFAALLDAAGQELRAKHLRESGLKLALVARDDYQSCLFLSSQMLHSLYKGDSEAAEREHSTLDRVDGNKRFQFESVLGKAVISGMKGQSVLSDSHFNDLISLKAHSSYIVPHWKAILAERRKDWLGLIEQMEELREISEKGNFRDELPGIYFGLAKGYWGLEKHELALEYANRSAAIIESDRPTEDAPLSLSMMEIYHSLYRLLAEIEERKGDPTASLQLVDYLKGRVLHDRIDNSAFRRKPDLSINVRQQADDLSARLVEGFNVRDQLAKLERSVTLLSPRQKTGSKSGYGLIGRMGSPPGTAIVSYFFTLDGRLRAFVVEHGKPVRIVKLRFMEKEADTLAETVGRKIREKVFFKSDGQRIYNILLRPLSLTTNEITIVPDKSLWKIPFHALSSDGEKYLIEEKQITYAPSVSTLVRSLKETKSERRTIRVFANDTYGNRTLKFANTEANKVASMFGTRAVINARAEDFKRAASSGDILHLSMHAELDADDPLRSFLSFRQTPTHDGRVTVEDLLGIKLKYGSFVFLASCDTNHILNGEGLVSLAWAMTGSGATSVVSSQWEANDRSTAVFAEHFYRAERHGNSLARSIQIAATAMIRDKKTGSHEPYFWAPFTLLGDPR